MPAICKLFKNNALFLGNVHICFKAVFKFDFAGSLAVTAASRVVGVERMPVGRREKLALSPG